MNDVGEEKMRKLYLFLYPVMDIKKEIFTRLDNIAKDGAILASNTSALDLNAIAAVTHRPQDIIAKVPETIAIANQYQLNLVSSKELLADILIEESADI